MKIQFITLLLCCFACFSTVKAQENPSKTISFHKSDDTPKEDTSKAEKITTRNLNEPDAELWGEKLPIFPGGDAALMKYLADNLNYPKKARRKGVEGTCKIKFAINEDGSISDIEILKDIGYGCAEECVRVINKMPKWTPGEQLGKRVKVKYTLPFRFNLK